MCLLFSPKRDPSPPHMTFNPGICSSIVTRGPSPGQRPERTGSGKQCCGMCGLGWPPSLSFVPFFPDSSHLSPGPGVLTAQTTLFCSCWPKNQALACFLVVCFPAGLGRIKAANHQPGPRTHLRHQRKPCKMLEKQSKQKSEASRMLCIGFKRRRLSV